MEPEAALSVDQTIVSFDIKVRTPLRRTPVPRMLTQGNVLWLMARGARELQVPQVFALGMTGYDAHSIPSSDRSIAQDLGTCGLAIRNFGCNALGQAKSCVPHRRARLNLLKYWCAAQKIANATESH